MNYAKHYGTRTTPQSQAIPGSGQVANSAGGFSWQIDDWMLLDRFLVLGTEGGSYYASEKKMTYQAGEATRRCIDADGVRVVKRVVEISDSGRAPKNDPAIFVLALCAGIGDGLTRKTALEVVPKVCRTGTHLFTHHRHCGVIVTRWVFLPSWLLWVWSPMILASPILVMLACWMWLDLTQQPPMSYLTSLNSNTSIRCHL